MAKVKRNRYHIEVVTKEQVYTYVDTISQTEIDNFTRVGKAILKGDHTGYLTIGYRVIRGSEVESFYIKKLNFWFF